MNHATFETSKELAKYLQVDTESYWEMTKGQADKSSYKILHKLICLFWDTELEFYPAPTLEELLKVSPITMNMHFENGFVKIAYWWVDDNRDNIEPLSVDLETADNLSQAVALIILEYYRSKE